MAQLTCTHKGWLLFCPVYIGDVDSDTPLVVSRHLALEPLAFLAHAIHAAACAVAELCGREPKFWLVITGELPEPIPATVVGK